MNITMSRKHPDPQKKRSRMNPKHLTEEQKQKIAELKKRVSDENRNRMYHIPTDVEIREKIDRQKAGDE